MGIIATAAVLLVWGAGAQAGDPAAGAADFGMCKACHSIIAADGTDTVKGGKTGPNLFGVIGRPVGVARRVHLQLGHGSRRRGGRGLG